MSNKNLKPEEQHRQMMLRCLELARLARGRTAPNPLVGSVIVQDGEIVGSGFHPQAGQPHAEIFALGAAGAKARGATLYVNLEPCNHYGRTPPCTEAIIAAGIKTVVIGMIDPNPRVSGEGVKRLEEAGISTIVGIEEAAARQLNEAFCHRVLYHRPLGILKYAMTLDGKIATSTGDSAWVSSNNSRRVVHQLRSEVDAVVVGGQTVRQDNPSLTTHGLTPHNPLRVVMSRSLDLPPHSHLWQTSEAKTLVFTGMQAPNSKIEKLLALGVEVLQFPELSPKEVMLSLYERGMSAVLWECGGQLAAQAIATGMIQKVVAFIAPKIVGGVHAPSPVGDLGINSMGEALLLERVTVQYIEPDMLMEGYLKVNL